MASIALICQENRHELPTLKIQQLTSLYVQFDRLKRHRHRRSLRLKFAQILDGCVRAMKKEMPILLFLVGLGLLLFFVYAAVTLGFDAISLHRNNVPTLLDSALGFVADNKLMVLGAVAVLVVVRLFMRTPRQARM